MLQICGTPGRRCLRVLPRLEQRAHDSAHRRIPDDDLLVRVRELLRDRCWRRDVRCANLEDRRDGCRQRGTPCRNCSCAVSQPTAVLVTRLPLKYISRVLIGSLLLRRNSRKSGEAHQDIYICELSQILPLEKQVHGKQLIDAYEFLMEIVETKYFDFDRFIF